MSNYIVLFIAGVVLIIIILFVRNESKKLNSNR
jgi:hypothetical protein